MSAGVSVGGGCSCIVPFECLISPVHMHRNADVVTVSHGSTYLVHGILTAANHTITECIVCLSNGI